MEVTCPSCSKKINLPEDKVPKGQSFSFGCPSCKEKIKVNPDGTTEQPSQGETFGDSDAPGALVCHTDHAKFKSALESMGFRVHAPSGHAEAINDLRLNNYRLVLVTDDFDTIPHENDGVLKHLQEMPMATRRKLFVAYVVKGARSYDNMEAFANSVNIVANHEDAAKGGFGEQLSKAMKSNDLFYKVYFECMTALGKS
ncbi:MAG: zinc-ribbon domain-containing protein [Nitrospinae bacterium]|nr:zinc-ribbon domain-containing protein [Nitrospinota bacterium]